MFMVRKKDKMGFFAKIFKQLPAIGKRFNTYSALTAALLGVILGVLLGNHSIIVIITAIVGIISAHSRLSLQGFSTPYLLPNAFFIIGLMITTEAVNGWILLIVYVIGMIVGRVVKLYF